MFRYRKASCKTIKIIENSFLHKSFCHHGDIRTKFSIANGEILYDGNCREFMRNYLITSVVHSISANTNLFSLYLTIVGHCCLHQVISRQVCWQSQIIEWDNPGQPCYCAERQIHISLKFKWLFLWYSREWIGGPKSFKSKDGKCYPNRSKTHRNIKISTVASYSLRFFLFSWPVLGDETLNCYLPTTIKMRGTEF